MLTKKELQKSIEQNKKNKIKLKFKTINSQSFAISFIHFFFQFISFSIVVP